MTNYSIESDIKFGFLKLMDVGVLMDEMQPWSNRVLCRVNDSVVRLGVVQGEFHWHKHDLEDEFFYVLQGCLYIDLEGGETVALKPHQGYTVPKGVVHRTRAEERTAMLMVEAATVTPTGDA
jgi:mannose-6-phosphate isomerase-like protein (cupin superfamily)